MSRVEIEASIVRRVPACDVVFHAPRGSLVKVTKNAAGNGLHEIDPGPLNKEHFLCSEPFSGGCSVLKILSCFWLRVRSTKIGLSQVLREVKSR